MSLEQDKQQSNLENEHNISKASSQELDKIIGKKFNILDHGFIRVIDYMGNDDAIVQAARVSYGKGTKKKSEDQGLINYLMRHRHTTPFEMCEIKFHLKMPIFVARQWIRHRTANVNEYSGRYSIMSSDYYLPMQENLSEQSKQNKQGRADEMIPQDVAQRVIQQIKEISDNSYEAYLKLLNHDAQGNIIEEDGYSITRELSRMVLGVNYYTEMYWKIDLHNLLHFLHLRADSHAQYEIRVYAEKMMEILKLWVPMAHSAFIDYRKNSVTMSEKMMNLVKRKLSGESIDQESSGLSKREWAEFINLIKA